MFSIRYDIMETLELTESQVLKLGRIYRLANKIRREIIAEGAKGEAVKSFSACVMEDARRLGKVKS